MGKLLALTAVTGALLTASGCGGLEQDPTKAEKAPVYKVEKKKPKIVPSDARKLATSKKQTNKLTREMKQSFEGKIHKGVEVDIALGACAIVGREEGDGMKVYFVPHPGNLTSTGFEDGDVEMAMSVAYDPESKDFIYGQRVIAEGIGQSVIEVHTIDDNIEELVGFGPGSQELPLPVKLSTEAEAVTIAEASDLRGHKASLPVMTVVESDFIKGDFDSFAASRPAQAVCEEITTLQPVGTIAPGERA